MKARLKMVIEDDKLIDKFGESKKGSQRYYDLKDYRIYQECNNCESGKEVKVSNMIARNFYLRLVETIETINSAIEINRKWMTTDEQMKIPIDKGFIIKEPLVEGEHKSVQKMIDKQIEQRIPFLNCLESMSEHHAEAIKNVIKERSTLEV